MMNLTVPTNFCATANNCSAYDSSKQPFSGLTMPRAAFLGYISKAQQLLVDTFPNLISKPGIANQLLSIIPKFQMKECQHFPSNFLVELFVRMRLHYMLKFGNRDIPVVQAKTKRQKQEIL